MDTGEVAPAGPAVVEATTVPPSWLSRQFTRARWDRITLIIVAATVVALGLRLYYLIHRDFLLSVTEYDDGPYFGSALRLTQGLVPYKDYVFVQPPGITILMFPAALAAKVVGTAWGLAIGRLLTVCSGCAAVVLTGRLVRHRGPLTTLIACGLAAVYPNGITASQTVLVEPWLVLFCLLGAVALFEGDRLTLQPRRVLWSGLAFGFAGAVEAWAIVPVLLLLVFLALSPPPGISRERRVLPFAGGVAAGFLVPVVPFAAVSPRGFWDSLITAQIGGRSGVVGIPDLYRFFHMTVLSNLRIKWPDSPMDLAPLYHGNLPLAPYIWSMTALLALLVIGLPLFLVLRWHISPAPLGWFAMTVTELIVMMFLWPPQFHYHFVDFLVPFLAIAIALPVGQFAAGRPLAAGQPAANGASPSAGRPRGRRRYRWVAGVTVAVLVILVAYQGNSEANVWPVVPAATVAHEGSMIPRGDCVVSDLAVMLILANRYNSTERGCTQINDPLGTELALSHGLAPVTGAGYSKPVLAILMKSFKSAQFIWFSRRRQFRIPGPGYIEPAFWKYFHQNFAGLYHDGYGDILYRRVKAGPGVPVPAKLPA